MYAWCLMKYGAIPPDQARTQAESFYEYEPATDQYRGLVFHDEAWHWAMIRIFGEGYWNHRPELSDPCKGYQAESEALRNEQT